MKSRSQDLGGKTDTRKQRESAACNYDLRRVQAMPVDTGTSGAHDRLMQEERLTQLGEAIAAALGRRTQQWLADEIGVHNSTISRIASGRQSDLALEQVRRIEEALGVPAGQLLRAAGYVDPVDLDTRAQIQSDGALEAEDRATLLRIYDLAVSARKGVSNTDASSTPPTLARRRRS